MNREDYLAVINEFDALWASPRADVCSDRMNELFATIQSFERQFIQEAEVPNTPGRNTSF